LLYEGKAKILYTTDEPEILLSYFKDDATAFNAQKRGISLVGEINHHLHSAVSVPGGVWHSTHFIDR